MTRIRVVAVLISILIAGPSRAHSQTPDKDAEQKARQEASIKEAGELHDWSLFGCTRA